jgi:hypothetical protein
MPTGSGIEMNLAEVADDIAQRLVSIFVPDEAGQRPVHGGREEFSREWDDMLLFYEYFHGDPGPGSELPTKPAGPAWWRQCCGIGGTGRLRRGSPQSSKGLRVVHKQEKEAASLLPPVESGAPTSA